MIRVINLSKDYQVDGGVHHALTGINFEVSPGEKVAIIGRNGSGKSTLVRMLAGIELPTKGTIERNMSISWPVALGGGVHPWLTGNDNIRFVARVYGRPFSEIRDFVEDFAQLGKFLSEPVRTYSSGMSARLNFALSLAIDFDCYLIDEILSVGDQRFQRRSQEELFGKRAERALILVSHIPDIIRTYCTRALVLHRGKGKSFDNLDLALEIYNSV